MRRPPGLRETESGSRQPRKQQREGSHAPHARPDRPGPQVSRPGTPFGRVFGPGGSRRFAFAHTPPSARLDRNPHKGCATRPEPRGFRILQAASGPCAHRWRPRPCRPFGSGGRRQSYFRRFKASGRPVHTRPVLPGSTDTTESGRVLRQYLQRTRTHYCVFSPDDRFTIQDITLFENGMRKTRCFSHN